MRPPSPGFMFGENPNVSSWSLLAVFYGFSGSCRNSLRFRYGYLTLLFAFTVQNDFFFDPIVRVANT